MCLLCAGSGRTGLPRSALREPGEPQPAATIRGHKVCPHGRQAAFSPAASFSSLEGSDCGSACPTLRAADSLGGGDSACRLLAEPVEGAGFYGAAYLVRVFFSPSRRGSRRGTRMRTTAAAFSILGGSAQKVIAASGCRRGPLSAFFARVLRRGASVVAACSRMVLAGGGRAFWGIVGGKNESTAGTGKSYVRSLGKTGASRQVGSHLAGVGSICGAPHGAHLTCVVPGRARACAGACSADGRER